MKILKKHKHCRISKRLGEMVDEVAYIQRITHGTFGSNLLQLELRSTLWSLLGALRATHKMIPPNIPAARKRGWFNEEGGEK